MDEPLTYGAFLRECYFMDREKVRLDEQSITFRFIDHPHMPDTARDMRIRTYADLSSFLRMIAKIREEREGL